jgi:hypothetical protein
MTALKSLILQDLENNLSRLLTLNISRREAIALHLDRLADQPLPAHELSTQPDLIGGLRRWIEEPRNPAQNRALKAYFEEIALLVLGQAILLKSWSDRCLRTWSAADLNDLNWAMNTALKPHIPLDRDSWQVVRQNIYSWYKPSAEIQREIWITLNPWKIPTENPTFLAALMASKMSSSPSQSQARKPAVPALPTKEVLEGYDSRFYQSLWENMPLYGFDPENSCPPYRRSWYAFTPTLRDGAVVRSGPASIQWFGLDASPFLVMTAELLQLWWGPSAPPLWAIGSGLEVPTRDQLSLTLNSGTTSHKPSLFSRIAEMEACDAAFVFEERVIRGQARSLEAQSFRDQANAIPYFKKLRAAKTSLGDLQACVALSKLRPGGLLWWSREEPLDDRAGAEVLNFLLDRAKLVCEWNFAEIEHSLPSAKPLFPRYIYLLQREQRLEERLAHRPMRIGIRGQLRSHVEIPLLLEDALQAPSHAGVHGSGPRGQWVVQIQQSPTAQKEWAERWPEATAHTLLSRLEALREASLPLASATTIRPTPDGDPKRGYAWRTHSSSKGFWVQAENRMLVTRPLPPLGEEATGAGFLVLVTDESVVAPLRHYLESEIVAQWLDSRCERKGERWVLNEQVVRWIPVRRSLLHSLGLTPGPSQSESSRGPVILPPEWERLASNLALDPLSAFEAVKRKRQAAKDSPHPVDPEGESIVSEIFVRAARTLERMRTANNPVLRLIDADGRIRWRMLLDVLPKSECVSIALQPQIRVQGNLPLQLPINEIAPIKTPDPGFVLATEAGLALKIVSDSQILRDMLWDQLQGLVNPTWSELLQYLKVPRRLEIAEETAIEVIRSHGEHTSRLNGLVQLLAECSTF